MNSTISARSETRSPRPSCRSVRAWNWPRRFLPASAERVSGDFYLVSEGPQDSTVLVVGDVVGHGLQAARRAAFARTTFAATAPFSDDPSRLLSWANTALIERAGTSGRLRHRRVRDLSPGRAALALGLRRPSPSAQIGRRPRTVGERAGSAARHPRGPRLREGSRRMTAGEGVLLYTDGLTEARREGQLSGSTPLPPRSRVSAAPHRPKRSPSCARAPPTSPTAPSPTTSACSPPASSSRAGTAEIVAIATILVHGSQGPATPGEAADREARRH